LDSFENDDNQYSDIQKPDEIKISDVDAGNN